MQTQIARGITISLPFPPRELSPNSRAPWRAKAQETAAYRRQAGWLARMAMVAKEPGTFPLTPPVTATVTFTLKNRRRRDLDNLLASIKAVWDGIVDAGLLKDDDAFSLHIVLAPVVVGAAGVSIRLEEERA